MIQDDNSWSSKSNNSWSSEPNSQRSNPNLSKTPSFHTEPNSQTNDSWGSPNLSKKPSFHTEPNSGGYNPYGSPTNEENNWNSGSLASRGSRFVAIILDLFFVWGIIIFLSIMAELIVLNGGIIGMILGSLFVFIV